MYELARRTHTFDFTGITVVIVPPIQSNSSFRRMYKVLGVMSGSSLDGLDLCISGFTQENGGWLGSIIETHSVPFPYLLAQQLSNARHTSALELTLLENEFTRFVASAIKTQFSNSDFELIGFHGHTVFHNPDQGYTLQIGNGALLAAECKAPVVYDFRRTDVALHGQGAPLVPVGDALLYGQYDACLNLGGIANLSIIPKEGNAQKLSGFDICACNQLLNHFANQLGLAYDEGGKLAKLGTINTELLTYYNSNPWLTFPYPKSLGNEYVAKHFIEGAPSLHPADGLATVCEHIAEHISSCINSAAITGYVLVSGGGAFNEFLIHSIQKKLKHATLELATPELINFKEAHLFAFLALLRCLNIENTWASVTGASKNAISGALVGINPYKK